MNLSISSRACGKVERPRQYLPVAYLSQLTLHMGDSGRTGLSRAVEKSRHPGRRFKACYSTIHISVWPYSFPHIWGCINRIIVPFLHNTRGLSTDFRHLSTVWHLSTCLGDPKYGRRCRATPHWRWTTPPVILRCCPDTDPIPARAP